MATVMVPRIDLLTNKLNSARTLDPNIIYLCAAYNKCRLKVLNKYRILFREKHILIIMIYMLCVIESRLHMHVCLSNVCLNYR